MNQQQTSLEAAQCLRERFPEANPKIALLLGSGWKGLVDHLRDPQSLPYAEIPGFEATGVQGHESNLVLGWMGSHQVVVLTGRKHTYETGQPDAMKLPIQALKHWGCQVLVQTNAAGSVRASMPPGSLMALNDHINLSQRSPLIGEAGSERFVSMVNAYDADLREQAIEVALKRGDSLHSGVYMWFVGPQFESPAEIRMAALLGADAVGMSTVPETIAARHAGLRVLAFSLITNMGAGLSAESLSHEHTLSQAAANSERATQLLTEIVASLRL